jgi:hypothetical protein
VSNESQPAEKTVAELLAMLVEGQKLLVEEIRGLRSDMEARTGPLGDPVIRKSPPKWNGPSFEGKRASECPWEFLEVYGDNLLWRGENPQEGKEKYAKGNLREGAVCMRWAMVNRGKVPSPAPLPPKKSFTRPAERAPDAAAAAAHGGADVAAPPPAKTTWSGGGSKWGKAPAA